MRLFFNRYLGAAFNKYWPGLALVALCGLFLRNALSMTKSFALHGDNEYFLGVVLATMSSIFSGGEWPLRAGEFLGGVPLYNFTQLSSFYPFYFWQFPVYGSPVETMQSMHWVTLLHVFVFQVNSYFFLRQIQLSRFAALVGACLIAFSANSLDYTAWVNIVAPYSWLPLFLTGLVGILQGEKYTRYCLIALSGAVLLTLASPAQPLIHMVFLTLIFSLAWGVQFVFRRRRLANLWSGYLGVLIVGVGAVLIVAPVLLPAVFEYGDMIRWVGTGSVIGNKPIPFEFFLHDQLAVKELLGIIFRIDGVGVGSQFVGVVTFSLAVLSFTHQRRSWLMFALCFLAVYSLLSSAGSNLGFAYLNHELPFINKIREPSRFLVLFQFSIGALAAFGLDALKHVFMQTKARLSLNHIVLLIFSALVIVLAYWVVQDRIKSLVQPAVSVGILLLLVLSSYGMSFLRHVAFRRCIPFLWGGAALLLLASEVRWSPFNISKSSSYASRHDAALEQVLTMVERLDPDHQYRVVFGGQIQPQFASMLASYQGIRTLSAYFNPLPYRQFQQMYYHGAMPDNYYQALGAKYLVCRECDGKLLVNADVVFSKEGYQVYDLGPALPKYYLATDINGGYSDFADARAKMAKLELSSPVLLMPLASEIHPLMSDERRCNINEVAYKSNSMEFDLACDTENLLVLNEYFDSNWKATINGVSVEVMPANGNQLAVALSSGSQQVMLKYRPSILIYSFWICLIGLICLAVFLLKAKFTYRTYNQSLVN